MFGLLFLFYFLYIYFLVTYITYNVSLYIKLYIYINTYLGIQQIVLAAIHYIISLDIYFFGLTAGRQSICGTEKEIEFIYLNFKVRWQQFVFISFVVFVAILVGFGKQRAKSVKYIYIYRSHFLTVELYRKHPTHNHTG